MNIDPSLYGDIMEKYYKVNLGLNLTRARTATEFYGFHYNHVALVHYHKQGTGGGVYFRLHDGRVFDVAAREHDPDPLLYDATTH